MNKNDIEKAVEKHNEYQKVDYTLLSRQLSSMLFKFTKAHPFYGSILQSLPIQFNLRIPTAALCYDKTTQNYRILVNPHFFTNLTPLERVAVFHHEILHFTYQHLDRFSKLYENANKDENNKRNEGTLFTKLELVNLACDMAINQLIQNLPKNAVDYKLLKDNTGKAFPALQTAETYYDLLDKNEDAQKQMKQDGKGTIDEHDWEVVEGLTEEEKTEMLKAAQKLVERAMEKANYTHSEVPGELKELLEKLKSDIEKLNYRAIIQNAIKRTVSSADRKSTWSRPNRRYSVYAPGNKLGDSPKLEFYFDMSGSMSVREINELLEVISGFLSVGSRQCNLNFFDTRIYKKMRYKKGQPITEKDVEGGGGGTCLNEVIKHIHATSPDMSIVMTDGYYGDVNRNPSSNEIYFIITTNGTVNHPLQKHGKTIQLSKLK